MNHTPRATPFLPATASAEPSAAAASQTSFFTLGALIAIGVSTFSPGKPSSEDSKSRPFMGRQASWLSELSTSTTAGGKRD